MSLLRTARSSSGERLRHPRGARSVQAERRADDREQRADEREDDDRIAPLAEVVEHGDHHEHEVDEQDAPADELPEQVGVFFRETHAACPFL